MAQAITQSIDLQKQSEQHLHRWDGVLCALLLAVCFLVAHPFVEMGFIDDWSYIKTTEVFAQTGHFAYNGWATVSLGWQVLWGALFSKLLGFSFVHVRLSTLPVAMASVYVFHQTLIRFGISRGKAIFGALSLALSPVFLLMSATYMTDIHGLFSTLLCLYLCLRAVSAKTDRAALGWLCVATVTNIAGATVRQTAWLGVLLIVPSAAWLLRKRHRVFWGGVLLWLIGIASFLACMHWFNQQPYFVPERIVPEGLLRARLKHIAISEISQSSKAFLCLLLLLFPILAEWFSLARSVPRRLLLWVSLATLVLLTGLLVYCFRHGNLDSCLAPWLAPVIGTMGAADPGDLPGLRPGPLHYRQRLVITLLVIAAALIFFVHLVSRLRSRSHVDQASRVHWSGMLWLFAPYILGYLGALMIQVVYQPLFDRYLLSLQAIGIIVLLRYYQDFATQDVEKRHSRFAIGRFPVASQLALAAFAYYAIAGTHDWFALSRARLEAAEQIRRSGVPRNAIQAGFEYDSWTQLEAAGHINDPRIRIPRHAFQRVRVSSKVRPACTETWFDEATLTPAVTPRYFLVFEPLDCLAPAPFSTVTYHAWMPPFTRYVYVQQRKQ